MTRLAALCWMGLILSLAACQTGSQRSVEQAEESAPPAEQAEESAPPADDRTSIVWLKGEADTNSSADIRTYLGTENLIDVIDTASGSFAVALPPEEVLGLLEKNEKFLSRLDHVEEDTEIFPFQPPRAGCTPQPISAAVNPPWGVKRVGGPAPAGPS